MNYFIEVFNYLLRLMVSNSIRYRFVSPLNAIRNDIGNADKELNNVSQTLCNFFMGVLMVK